MAGVEGVSSQCLLAQTFVHPRGVSSFINLSQRHQADLSRFYCTLSQPTYYQQSQVNRHSQLHEPFRFMSATSPQCNLYLIFRQQYSFFLLRRWAGGAGLRKGFEFSSFSEGVCWFTDEVSVRRAGGGRHFIRRNKEMEG